MITNKDKFQIFLDVTEKINKSFNVIPILYGSLGLSLLIPEDIKVNNINILLPEQILDYSWIDLIDVMNKMGFDMVDEHEHQFRKGDYKVAFALDDELLEQTGAASDDLDIVKNYRVSYKVLDLEQYLRFYINMLRDDYKQQKSVDADIEKIILINEYLYINKG